MKYSNLLKIINESSSIGSTCAANVAVSPNSIGFIKRGSLGVGFNPNGDYGIYSKPIKENISDIEKQWEEMGIDFWISEKGPYIIVSKIVVPENNRNNGIGTKAMNMLMSYADTNGKIIALTPDTAFGGKITKLRDFYRKLGFVKNSGNNKDYSTKEQYIRYPK